MMNNERTLWQTRWQMLLSKIEIVDAEAQLQASLNAMLEGKSPQILAFVNAHAMNSIVESAEFFDALATADTIYRDGTGMAILYQMLDKSPGLNLNGTDLIPKIIQKFNGHPIALYGTRDQYLKIAAQTIHEKIAPQSKLSFENGFLSNTQYVQIALEQRPRLIVLGMGMPKQELVAAQLRQSINFPCLIVCGGAIIDFLGGKVARAPQWMRTIHSEWVFRLAQEPRRLFKRYVKGNPVFIGLALRFKYRKMT